MRELLRKWLGIKEHNIPTDRHVFKGYLQTNKTTTKTK